jgi:hypothetical protein
MKTTNHAESIGGKPVINARKRLRVRITAKDVQTAKTRDPGACAAAKALIRTVPGCVAARVHLGRTYILTNKGNWSRYKTPDALRSEIVALDRGGKFEPGDYELRPLPPSAMFPKSRAKSGSDTNRNKNASSPTKRPRKLHVMTGVRPRGANR